MNERQVYWDGRSSSNDLRCGSGFCRQAGDGVASWKRKRPPSSSLFTGCAGVCMVTFEEGTWAAWLYDLLKPHVSRSRWCAIRERMPC